MVSTPLSLLRSFKVARQAAPWQQGLALVRPSSHATTTTTLTLTRTVSASRLSSRTPSLSRSITYSSRSAFRVAPISTSLSNVNSASTLQQLNSDEADHHQQQDETLSMEDDVDFQRIKLTASRAQTPLSIAQCLMLGQTLNTKSLLKNLTFLNRELPVRFSKRIVELSNLPSELRRTEPIINLIKNYTTSFNELQAYSDNSRLWYVIACPCVIFFGRWSLSPLACYIFMQATEQDDDHAYSPQMGHTQDTSPYFFNFTILFIHPTFPPTLPIFLACLLLTKVTPSLT